MSDREDVENGDFEKELNSAHTDGSSCGYASITKEPISPAVSPSPKSRNVLDGPRGARRGSEISHSSSNSQKTLSDHGFDHQTATPHRERSRAQSSTRSVKAEKVPRSKRRGLLGRVTIIAEVTNPYDYPRKTKWFLTFVIAVAGATAPMASSIVLPALGDIARDLHSDAATTNLSVAMYMLSMAIFPLWWSEFSETLGRRTIYLTTFALYILCSIVGGFSTGIGMFLAMRMLSGASAASVQSVGAGSVADLWEPRERGRAMGMFYLGPLCGPLLSPIIGGLLTKRFGWRSIQWFLTALGAIVLVFVLFCLPETLKTRKSFTAIARAEVPGETVTDDKGEDAVGAARPNLSRVTTKQSVVQLKTKRYITILRRCLVDPLRIVLYLQFPAVAFCVCYATVAFGALYSLNLSIAGTFSQQPYHYSSIIVGLLYLPNSLGYFLTSILGGKWVDNIMAREARKAGRYDYRGKLQYRPEDRMRENAWVGALMFPAALIVYGWTAEYGINVAAPMVANFFFGIGSMLIFAMVTTMLTEFMPRRASSGIALNNCLRNIFSCIGAAVTEPVIHSIGNGWWFTILGVLSLVTGIVTILASRRYGARWRKSMDQKMDRVMGE